MTCPFAMVGIEDQQGIAEAFNGPRSVSELMRNLAQDLS